MRLFELIESNWKILSEAPFAFAALFISAFILAFGLARYLHNTELKNKESQLTLANDQIRDYERKLRVNSPEEAGQQYRELQDRVQDLEQALSRIGPRRLTEAEKTQIVQLVSKYAGRCIAITKDGASPDAAKLSSDFVDAFRRAGWDVQCPMVIGIGNPPRSGIAVCVPEESVQTPEQREIVNALRAANINFEFRPFNGQKNLRDNPPIAEIILTTPAD